MSALNDVELTEDVRGRSTAYLNNLIISAALQNDGVRPCSRGRISEDLSEISGLSALLAAGAATRTSIDGSNVRLIERMIRLSEAQVRLGHLVTTIAPMFSRRYKLSVKRREANEAMPHDEGIRQSRTRPAYLDRGIHFSGIDLVQDNAYSSFIPSHVTHSSSTSSVSVNISARFVDVDLVNDRIITTSALQNNQNILNIQRAAACFRRGCVDGSECDQCDHDTYLYRMHSRRYLEDKEIIQTIGLHAEYGKELSH